MNTLKPSEVIVGQTNGFPVIYDRGKDTVFCKNTVVSREPLFQAFKSKFDRVNINNDLVLRRHAGGYTLACLELTFKEVKQLILNIKNVRNEVTKNTIS